jgi:hypothetical protein
MRFQRTTSGSNQIILCSYAKAVAAARLGTSSLSKILLTCRSTVLTLRNSSRAITDGRWQIAGSRQRIAPGADDVADCCRDRLAFALCEPQQRKAGLWLAPVLAGLAKRFSAASKIAAQPQQLATLVAHACRLAWRRVVPGGASDFLHAPWTRRITDRIRRPNRQSTAPHLPAISTVHAVLDRHGLVMKRRRRRPGAAGTALSRPSEPTALW